MSKTIGIHLGMNYAVGAFSEAKVEVITNSNNCPPDRKLTRSVVADVQGKLVVGEHAYNNLHNDPENVIVSINRLIGRNYSDAIVQQLKEKYRYRIDRHSNGEKNAIAVWMGGKEYQPEDISAEILRKVVQNAKEYRQSIGKAEEVINQAVITIPAYFNDKQKQATRTAAFKAGLTPLELLAEPTAAAISYGYSPYSDDVKTILVYDFGAEAFDATLITAAGTQFIESGKAGDFCLWGDDVNLKIIQFVKDQVAKEEGLNDIDSLIEKMPRYQKFQLKAELKTAAERAKIELSTNTIARIDPATALLDEMGYDIPIEVEITREQFEEIIAPLVDRTIEICHIAIQISEYTPDLVDVILLTGGSSQIPLVQRKVKEAFGADKVVVHPHPTYAIAEGAAIIAAGKAGYIITEKEIDLSPKRSYMNSNPYNVLGLTRAVSKKEIVMAKMAAMKKKQYPLNAIAEAEKALLDPQKRIIADFLLPVLPTIQRFKRADLSALNEVLNELEFLEEFDGLSQAIDQANQISESDIQIGKALVASIGKP